MNFEKRVSLQQKMKFSAKDFFSKCDQIRSFLCVVFIVAMLLQLLFNKLDICMNANVAAAWFLKQIHQRDLFMILYIEQEKAR